MSNKKHLFSKAYLVREPLDEAVFVEVRGHADEGRKPGECVPCPVVTQALLPGDNVSDEHDAQAQQGSCYRVDADGASKDPEGNCD